MKEQLSMQVKTLTSALGARHPSGTGIALAVHQVKVEKQRLGKLEKGG